MEGTHHMGRVVVTICIWEKGKWIVLPFTWEGRKLDRKSFGSEERRKSNVYSLFDFHDDEAEGPEHNKSQSVKSREVQSNKRLLPKKGLDGPTSFIHPIQASFSRFTFTLLSRPNHVLDPLYSSSYKFISFSQRKLGLVLPKYEFSAQNWLRVITCFIKFVSNF